MKNYILSLFFALGIFSISLGQKLVESYDVKGLQVQWEATENNYNNTLNYLSAFTLTNNSKTEFPTKGWSIYFDLPRLIDTTFDSKEFKVRQVNGDLIRITPTSSFQGLAPGKSIRIEFVANLWTLNRADAPLGLYLVWDSAPQNGLALTNYIIKPSTDAKQFNRVPDDKQPVSSSSVVYKNNKVITDLPEARLPKIFPTPISYEEKSGSYQLKSDVTISSDKLFEKEGNYLSNELQKVLGKKPSIISTNGNIQLVKKVDLGKEAYELSVSNEKIIISASTSAGAFYGIQSLKSLLPATAWASVQKSIVIPAVEVKDEPRFAWRAFLLDVGRNFQPKAEILKTLDVLSLYKINVFHLHFAEDEGWRIEIPGLPELTEIGGKRGHADFDKKQLPPSFGSGPDNNSYGSGFYTKADFIEILKYAHERHITVIPEIETPGHARAAVTSMQVRYDRLMKEGKKEEALKYLLRHPEDKSVHISVQGWTDNVMDVSMPSTYTFIEKVIDELAAMYKEANVPIETINIGGDEVPAGSWEKSPAFAKVKSENKDINSTDDLWYYFFGKVSKILKDRNLYLYGWEEVGMRKTLLDENKTVITNPDFLNQNTHLDVWNNVLGWGAEDLAYKLANAGYKIVLSPVSNLYFDMSYNKSFEEEGYYWGGFIDVDKPFSFIPFDFLKNSKTNRMGHSLPANFSNGKERLTDFGKSNIVGMQACLFAETIVNPERMEYMMLPKLLGLAERAWAKDPEWAIIKDSTQSQVKYKQAWSEFANVIGKRELPRLNYYAGGFKYRIPTPGAILENGNVVANVQLPGFVIRYTTDGSNPTEKSKIYNGPIKEKGTIKLSTFDSKGRGSRVVEIKN